ncbi:hypothetical protein IFM89_005082 [Coptis chinensis]|uniref:Uncharacterized protein n=1 Tax=Coptis chinensis TaxID=261450 RepID=A0A835IM32_9MAGN|nr:hypothetical protein IFM89_005082 [Coptis chinensis]
MGRVTKVVLAPLVDKIRNRATGWAGKMLSFQGRVVLARHVLNSIPVHNMAIYKWPTSVIKECETIIRNFIWSDNPADRKSFTVSWEKSCKPLEEGGLGLRRLKDINLSMLMKQAWCVLTEESDWATFMRGKYTNSLITANAAQRLPVSHSFHAMQQTPFLANNPTNFLSPHVYLPKDCKHSPKISDGTCGGMQLTRMP